MTATAACRVCRELVGKELSLEFCFQRYGFVEGAKVRERTSDPLSRSLVLIGGKVC